jgi:hypothetical protein
MALTPDGDVVIVGVGLLTTGSQGASIFLAKVVP